MTPASIFRGWADDASTLDLGERSGHPRYFDIRELREKRHRQNTLASGVRHRQRRKVALLGYRLLMVGDRIVDIAANTVRRENRLRSLAIVDIDYGEMGGKSRAGSVDHATAGPDRIFVGHMDLTPTIVPGVKVWQLRPQNRTLEFVKTRIPTASESSSIRGLPAILPQMAQLTC